MNKELRERVVDTLNDLRDLFIGIYQRAPARGSKEEQESDNKAMLEVRTLSARLINEVIREGVRQEMEEKDKKRRDNEDAVRSMVHPAAQQFHGDVAWNNAKYVLVKRGEKKGDLAVWDGSTWSPISLDENPIRFKTETGKITNPHKPGEPLGSPDQKGECKSGVESSVVVTDHVVTSMPGCGGDPCANSSDPEVCREDLKRIEAWIIKNLNHEH